MNPEELWLYSICKKNGLYITDIEINHLSQFKNLLLDWNEKINLISRKNENIWKEHISLSLFLLFKIEFRSGMRILDLGTGGGLPGIPLSIIRPDCQFFLLDSTQKKVTAVQSMADSLLLSNIKTLWGRAEQLHQKPEFHRSFDIVIARSVSKLTNLFAWGLPFLKSPDQSSNFDKAQSVEKLIIDSPSLIMFKGGEIKAEEAAAKKRFPKVKLHTIPLTFQGSKEFENQDKKLVIATL